MLPILSAESFEEECLAWGSVQEEDKEEDDEEQRRENANEKIVSVLSAFKIVGQNNQNSNATDIHGYGRTNVHSDGNIDKGRDLTAVKGIEMMGKLHREHVLESMYIQDSEAQLDLWKEDVEALHGSGNDDTVAACEDVQTKGEVVEYEMHILYDALYQVPKLMFVATKLDGSPCSLREVMLNMKGISQSRLFAPLAISPSSTETKSVVSQDDHISIMPALLHEPHPRTGETMICVHPCETQSWMNKLINDHSQGSNLKQPKGSWLLAWWNVIGAMFGFGFQPEDYLRYLDRLENQT